MIAIRPVTASANLFLVAIFPGFFFYYSLSALGIIQPPPFGYFGSACAATLCSLGLAHVLRIYRYRTVHVHGVLIGLLVCNLGLVAAINRMFGNGLDVFSWHAQTIAEFLACCLVFRYADFKSNGARVTLIACCVVMATIVFSNIDNGQFYLKLAAEGEAKIPSYQGFALAIFVTFFAASSVIESNRLRMSVHAMALLLLYLNGARSELAGYIAYAGFFEFLEFRNKARAVALVIASSIALAAIFIATDLQIEGNRIISILTPDEDTSLAARSQLLSDGVNSLIDSPIFGAYGSYAPGDYIHNALSAWVDAGPIELLLLIALLGSLGTAIFRLSRRDATRKAAHAAAGMLAACILLLLTSKYFLYIPLAVVCGFTSSAISRNTPIQRHAYRLLGLKFP